jgi:transcriptional regulator with XRE-family HTH domain
MTGYHTRRVRPPDQAEDPERVAIREALAFGKAVYDQRRALGLSVAELAGRADMTVDEMECIEEGGTEPTIALLRRLAAALDADVRLTAGHDLGSVWFEPHAACPDQHGRLRSESGQHRKGRGDSTSSAASPLW